MVIMVQDFSDYDSWTDDDINMLLDLRRLDKEADDGVSRSNYRDWEEADYDIDEIIYSIGEWNIAKSAAGLENLGNRDTSYTADEVVNVINELAEERLEYEYDGERVVSEEGEMVPITEITALRSQTSRDIPSKTVITRRLPEKYVQFMQDLGYSHPRNWDWEKVEERLIDDIENDVGMRGFNGPSYPEGEIPSPEYIDNKDNLPSYSWLLRNLGPQDQWLEELGLEDEQKADDVDVDLTKFDM